MILKLSKVLLFIQAGRYAVSTLMSNYIKKKKKTCRPIQFPVEKYLRKKKLQKQIEFNN